MRCLRKLFLSIVCPLLLASCSKSDNDSTDDIPIPPVAYSAYVDSTLWTTSKMIVTMEKFVEMKEDPAGKVITIDAYRAADDRLGIGIFDYSSGRSGSGIRTGTYIIPPTTTNITGNHAFIYYQGKGDTIPTMPKGGKVVVTSCDPAGLTISGTFEGIMQHMGMQDTIRVTRGSFQNVRYTIRD